MAGGHTFRHYTLDATLDNLAGENDSTVVLAESLRQKWSFRDRADRDRTKGRTPELNC